MTRSRAAAVLRRQIAWLRTQLSRSRLGMPVTAAGKAGLAVAAVAVLSAGMVPAAMAALHGPAAAQVTVSRSQLTTTTNAPCNAPPEPGHVQCFAVVHTPADHAITPDAAGPPAGSLSPADIQAAYNLPSGGAGSGQTVATVIWGDDPDLESDLAVFRSQYGLPPCTTANGCFRKVNQDGQQSNYPSDQGTAIETSLDVDAISSACPACNILVVEVNSSSSNDTGAGVDEAVSLGAKFISNSYGDPGEAGASVSDNTDYDHPGVVVTVSSGDTGDVVDWPSSDPNVVAVGGTTLAKDTSVSRGWDETAWGTATVGQEGGGSGCSSFEPQPSFQGNIPALDAVCSNRATADISADANPASGIAEYNTDGGGGWLQVGGTSLASPLIAAMYALAGSPAMGAYPVTYPYQDTNDLNDITSGSNGSCGNILCQAGPGWDGPTGLGSPDGIKALAPPGHGQGTITGQVTNDATGAPVAGARVVTSPGSEGTSTDSRGDYTLSGLATGTYTLSVSDFTYTTKIVTGVAVTDQATTTENVTLTQPSATTVSGTVSDGSGHGWPLYAEITIDGDPDGPVYTDPATGKYTVTLPDGSQTFHVTPVYGGYQTATQTVQLDQPDQTVNLTAQVDATTCSAPGYGWNGFSTDFLGWTGRTAQDGWTVSGPTDGWRFDDPGNRQPPAGGDDSFAIADSFYSGSQAIDTALTSPAIDLRGQQHPALTFNTRYVGAQNQTGTVQLSTDNGQHWTTIWQQTNGTVRGQRPNSGFTAWVPDPVSLDLSRAAGQPKVQVRFSFTGRDGGYWAVDNIFIGTSTCMPLTGGLVIGNATDAATGADLPGVSISRDGDSEHSATTIATLGDPNVGDGFYWLFVPAGSSQLTATDEGYTTAQQSVSVQANQVVTRDWTLAAG